MRWPALLHDRPVLCIVVLSLALRVAVVASLLLMKRVIPSFDQSALLLLAPSEGYLEPLVRWDTFYYLKSARQEGWYARDNELAFMPGLPGAMRATGVLLSWLRGSPPGGLEDLVWGGVLAAAFAGVAANVALFHLTYALLGSKRYAILTSLLFLIPPSQPTLNAVPYTEPFAALCTFLGMYLYVTQQWAAAAGAWAFGSGFRAQGIVLGAGFFGWEFVLGAWSAGRLSKLAIGVPQFVLLSSLAASPFLTFQYWAYQKFCDAVPSELRRPWCDQGLGLSYGWIQSEYWNVGLFRYWTLLQIPNFVLAAPVLALSVAASWTFYSHNLRHVLSSTLPFLCIAPVSQHDNDPKRDALSRPFLSIQLTPFIHLHTALTLMLLFASHVQIILRVSVTNPVIFWFVADLIHTRSRWGRRWVTYCLVWGSVSIFLWAGFYPPA